MKTVSKDEFDAFMLKHDPTIDIEYERDFEYGYDTYTTTGGKEIGFISYHSHQPTTYHIAD